jgi:tRNA uracil 4-sulfurtransferase
MWRMEAIFVYPHELSLKGRNRPQFVSQLAANIRRALAPLGLLDVRKIPGRLVLLLEKDARAARVREQLSFIPGVAYSMPVWRGASDMETLAAKIVATLSRRTIGSFRVTARRQEKTFPLRSQEIQQQLGAMLAVRLGAKVDLHRPELTVYIEVLYGGAVYVGFEKIVGTGGLPVGTSGMVVVLLSGGIDSPVASWMLMRRGCRAVFVHFHSYPYVSAASKEKAIALARILDRFQQDSRAYLVPFGDIQKQIVLTAPAPYRVLLYRRMMVRIAGEIARRERAKALATGESIGQVASQTLENIAVVEDAATLPILRPLAGMHKEEIITRAKTIGTYDISIMPDEDCCVLYVPKHPATKARAEELRKAETALDISALVAQGIAQAEKHTFS